MNIELRCPYCEGKLIPTKNELPRVESKTRRRFLDVAFSWLGSIIFVLLIAAAFMSNEVANSTWKRVVRFLAICTVALCVLIPVLQVIGAWFQDTIQAAVDPYHRERKQHREEAEQAEALRQFVRETVWECTSCERLVSFHGD